MEFLPAEILAKNSCEFKYFQQFYFDLVKCKCPVAPGAPAVGGGGGGAACAYETGAWGVKVEIC